MKTHMHLAWSITPLQSFNQGMLPSPMISPDKLIYCAFLLTWVSPSYIIGSWKKLACNLNSTKILDMEACRQLNQPSDLGLCSPMSQGLMEIGMCIPLLRIDGSFWRTNSSVALQRMLRSRPLSTWQKPLLLQHNTMWIHNLSFGSLTVVQLQ